MSRGRKITEVAGAWSPAPGRPDSGASAPERVGAPSPFPAHLFEEDAKAERITRIVIAFWLLAFVGVGFMLWRLFRG